ncbi:hypothetical protein TanjilG_21623 [Lupinus angustifolius]|uniref:Uncharacterized protein n=1 Tax=Lupinus angustifolius TaxID=3871 RepID=A0A4P1QUQ1_LUPAN|nr:PREDICTED: protein trichome birefringence-like 19 isoform X2 [Lupinus angustifolius]OIV95233.1 hypothetical protein TanjilG_21623 [Lupinus angustifolius]
MGISEAKIPKGVLLLPLSLLIILVLLPLIRNLTQSSSSKIIYGASLETTERNRCNIFSGQWIPYPKESYYNNNTCPFILDQLNCISSGRPDKEFMKLRWKPDECELPQFDATQFMKLVRGKSLAFVGDSMGRNQMESLICLINSVAHPEDITAKRKYMDENYFRWWFSAEYNFTVAILWSPFLVKATDSVPKDFSFNSAMNLYLDEADKSWTSQLENFDYVIISTGQWFYRPMIFYENGQLVGFQKGSENNITDLNFYGYKKAFQTTFKAISKGFKGSTFLVTHSPKHFENGEWYEGGACDKTKPFTKEERSVYKYMDSLKSFYQIQMEEFEVAEKEARKKGLHFGLIDITEAMITRADAHPSRYGHTFNKNKKVNDCVHWCLPGPIDTWNEFLLYMMKLESEKSYHLT